mmetsp:Transcript_15332/g.29725  ORF Transcript_15332/g.29725 Transcript_15332/m.29725 type:complete len:203 (+) Transcript_15332:1808-2416(+)
MMFSSLTKSKYYEVVVRSLRKPTKIKERMTMMIMTTTKTTAVTMTEIMMLCQMEIISPRLFAEIRSVETGKPQSTLAARCKVFKIQQMELQTKRRRKDQSHLETGPAQSLRAHQGPSPIATGTMIAKPQWMTTVSTTMIMKVLVKPCLAKRSGKLRLEQLQNENLNLKMTLLCSIVTMMMATVMIFVRQLRANRHKNIVSKN